MHLTNTSPNVGSNLMHISQSCKRKGKHLCLLCENKAPSTCTGIFLKTKIFPPSVLALRPHVNGVFGHQTRRFSKTVPRVDFFFQKCQLLVFVWTETKVFKYDDVIHHRAHALQERLSYFHCFSFLVLTGEGRQ